MSILHLPMQDNDAQADTIGEYLSKLFLATWDCEKRPFGNSGWHYELYEPLVRHGFIAGTLDEEYGYLKDVDDRAGDKLIRELIKEMVTIT